MNVISRDFAGGTSPLSIDDNDGSTIRFATDSGLTVTIAVDSAAQASREEVLVKAKDAVRQLAAAFEEADAARKRADARRAAEKDTGALFRSWAYR